MVGTHTRKWKKSHHFTQYSQMDKQIKRKTIWLLCTGLIVLIGVIAGALYLFNTIFPKAGPINVPEIEDIVSVSISCGTSDQTAPLRKEDMEQLLEYLSKGKPTRQTAMNDHPTERTYYSISVQTDIREYCYFIYEKGEQIYIEVPYEGIYEAQAELFDLIFTYHQET